MSVLAACAHKSEWVCRSCAKCSSCCTCETFDSVHIGTKAAADALARYARLQRRREKDFEAKVAENQKDEEDVI